MWGGAEQLSAVAVIGLGGLGHVAVKIAHALGAEVTVLSQSLRKKDDGLKLGADHYYATFHPFALIGGNKILAGSMIGGIPETQVMLDFCAEHGIGAEVERIAASEINEAYQRLAAGDVRYRFVIDTTTI
jgi:uncharacterized zinc-type alcohol dehydrogenase-like protein